MENASKALLMAAGVILGIMLLSVMIYMFRAGAKVNEKYDLNQASLSLENYNSKFTSYDRVYRGDVDGDGIVDGDLNTIADMTTLINLAYDVNKSSNYDEGNLVEIEINIGSKRYGIDAAHAQNISRNEIYDFSNGNVISVYDLMNKTLNELGITITDGNADERLIESRLDQATARGYEYKYIFNSDPNGIEYHEINGKIARMEFNCAINNDY